MTRSYEARRPPAPRLRGSVQTRGSPSSPPPGPGPDRCPRWPPSWVLVGSPRRPGPTARLYTPGSRLAPSSFALTHTPRGHGLGTRRVPAERRRSGGGAGKYLRSGPAPSAETGLSLAAILASSPASPRPHKSRLLCHAQPIQTLLRLRPTNAFSVTLSQSRHFSSSAPSRPRLHTNPGSPQIQVPFGLRPTKVPPHF